MELRKAEELITVINTENRPSNNVVIPINAILYIHLFISNFSKILETVLFSKSVYSTLVKILGRVRIFP